MKNIHLLYIYNGTQKTALIPRGHWFNLIERPHHFSIDKLLLRPGVLYVREQEPQD